MYKVMIVEDEPVIRKGIIDLIDWKGLECKVAADFDNGGDAITYLQRERVDIVITDIKMPVASGLEVAQFASEQCPWVKTIIVTAYSDFDYAKQSIKCGVIDFIVKTDYIEEIPIAVNKAVKAIKEHPVKVDAARNSVSDNSSAIIAANADALIQRLYSVPLSLDNIAKEMHISKSYLCKVYKKETGLSIIDALNRHRIEVAKELLKTTDKKIQEVSTLTGFDSAQYFTNVFAKYAGMTPKEFQYSCHSL